MRTIKNLLWVLSAGLLITSCSKVSYKKTKGGLPYQIIKGSDTTKVNAGDVIKLQFTRKIKDSVDFTTENSLPIYMAVGPTPQPYDISELWTEMRVGDSAIATQMIDTFLKRNPQSVPQHLKKGDKITYYIKIIQRFTSDSAARADYDRENAEWAVKEVATIEKYLADKKISAQKTPSGAFVEIITPGTGAQVDSGKYVSLKYTGTSWSGKKFDSNDDPAFPNKEPLSFVVGTGSMIKGFDEGVRLLKLGSKAKFYVPSMLAYGGNPGSPLIKPFENLMFDIEVIGLQDKMPAQPVPAQPQINVDPGQLNK